MFGLSCVVFRLRVLRILLWYCLWHWFGFVDFWIVLMFVVVGFGYLCLSC